MDFQVLETVKLKSNGELVEIYLVKERSLIVRRINHGADHRAEETEVPFDAVEKHDAPAVSGENDLA